MLFQVRQRYNEDDLRALDLLHQKKNRLIKTRAIYFRVCAAVTAVVLLFATGLVIFRVLSSVVRGTILLDYLIMAVWFVFIPAAIVLLIQITFSRTVNKAPLDYPERVYAFYEDYFIVEEPGLTVKRAYAYVNKFVETDDRFFLYIDVNLAYILRRSCFTAGTPEEFGPFLREKYRTKDLDPTEKGL